MEKHCELHARCSAESAPSPETDQECHFPVSNEVAIICNESKLKMYSCTEEIPVEDTILFYLKHNQYPNFKETFTKYLARNGNGANYELPEWLMKCFLKNLENPVFKDLIKNFHYHNLWQGKGEMQNQECEEYTFSINENSLSQASRISRVIIYNERQKTSIIFLKKIFHNPIRRILNSKGDANILEIFRSESINGKNRAQRFLCQPLNNSDDVANYELIEYENGRNCELMSGDKALSIHGNHHLSIILDSLCSLALLHEHGFENLDFAMENIAIGNPKTLTGKPEYYGKAIDYESICKLNKLCASNAGINLGIVQVPSSKEIQALNIAWYPFRTQYFKQDCFLAFINDKKGMKGKTGSAIAGASIKDNLREYGARWNELDESSPGHKEKKRALTEIIEKLQNPEIPFFARDGARLLAEVIGVIDLPDYSWLKEEHPIPSAMH